MKNNLKATLAFALALLVAMPAWAYDFSVRMNYGDMLYFDIVNAAQRQVKVVPPVATGGDHYASHVRPAGVLSIPSVVEYNGISYEVVAIGERAFSGCLDIRTITIPATVHTIEPYAFYGCTGIKGSIVIGENVRSIGNSAFYGCTGVNEVLFRAENCTTMGGSMSMTAFGNCRNLKSVKIFEGVKVLPDYAFCGMDALSDSVQLPSSLERIGAYAFAYCSSLPGRMVIPDSVTTIGECAFHQCHKISSVTIGASVRQIGGRAFYHCIGLKQVVINATTPPQVAATSFSEVKKGIPFKVPCVSKKMYSDNAEWHNYAPFSTHGSCSITIDASVLDPVTGSVVGGGSYNYGDNVKLMALCAEGYAFEGWSDGNRDNPRTLQAKDNLTVRANMRRAMTIVQKDTVYVVDTVYRQGTRVIRDTVDFFDAVRSVTSIPEITVDSPKKRIKWNFSRREKVTSVALYDQLGECLYTGNGRRGDIDMSRYRTGTYYVRIQTNNRVLRARCFYNANSNETIIIKK